MKNRGKSVKTEQERSKLISNCNNFSSSSNHSCKKHPSNSSSVGICAYCLNEKLIKLVCSDCGEQRISSCSCSGSNLSSYRNSSCNLDVGSVGRISFLIENEKAGNFEGPKTLFSHLKLKQSETEDDVVLLKRSSSCGVEVKKSYGFWKIKNLFKKKREKEGFRERNKGGSDHKTGDCVMDVSRSRSLSSFMGDKFDDEICEIDNSSAKISDFIELGRMEDDEEFIDLKVDLFGKSKTEEFDFKKHDKLDSMVDYKGIKKVKNSHLQAWNWIYKHHSGTNDHNHILRS